LIRRQQILRPQLVTSPLGARRRILEAHRNENFLPGAIHAPQHRSDALVRIRRARVLHHLSPGLPGHSNHAHSSSQKCSLRYLSAPSQSMVTISPLSPRAAISRPSCRAAHTLPPDEIPTSNPSRRASCLTMLCASSVSIHRLPSASDGS